jgi:repressor LexA
MVLTRRQKQVLDFLRAFQDEHGYCPSFEEIAEGLKHRRFGGKALNSLATVHKHLDTLERKGYIRRSHNQSRSIEIVQLPRPVREEVARHATDLPLVGRIAAGRPVESFPNPDKISLSDFARAKNVYVLEVKGDSMVDDHILDGDYIIVEQTEAANNRDIVVALLRGEETTLKRFFREPGGKIRLQPANAQMQPILAAAKDVQIQGRVIGVLRRY